MGTGVLPVSVLFPDVAASSGSMCHGQVDVEGRRQVNGSSSMLCMVACWACAEAQSIFDHTQKSLLVPVGIFRSPGSAKSSSKEQTQCSILYSFTVRPPQVLSEMISIAQRLDPKCRLAPQSKRGGWLS